MREPSRHGIRGPILVRRGRGCLLALLALAGLAGVRDADAQAITRYVRDTGNINFVTTGGTLRNSASTTCTFNATSSQTLSGIPAGTTIRNAYLYWGGSGATAAFNDTTVSLNGNTVTASRSFSRTWVNGGTNYPFFGDFANVTGIVTGNGTYTFGNLTVNTGTPHSGNSTCAGGWALIVIYESASERLRAINVFDGLDYFYGSALTLTPDGFRVPNTNIDGRIAVFTLDGDPGNSTTNNGFDEALRYNGNLLDDGLVPAGSNPTVQQFDGTINTSGVVTSYGVDVDQYDISSFLVPGATSGTTLYSAGSDLVLLMAQVVSATSDPAVDLGITKTHSGNFTAGGTGTYSITVSNAAGVEREDNIITVTDTLPAGLTYNSSSGTGWSCSAAGQVVTCTHAPMLNAGSSLPVLSLVVNVGGAAIPSANNAVTVSSASFDYNTANNSATDATTVVGPNMSTSTKTVQDLNGGEAAPGDTLRYTITMRESAGFPAVNVSVTDDVPANTSGFGMVSLPPGATNASLPAPNGANGTGYVNVTGIAVPANGSVTVVFDVVVPAGATPGTPINNTATVDNPNGPDATPAAPQVLVTPSLIPGSGVKPLYLRRLPALQLSRIAPLAAEAAENTGPGAPDMWTLTPALQQAITIPANSISVRLWLTCSSPAATGSRTLAVTLANAASGFSATDTRTLTLPCNSHSVAGRQQFQFVIPNAVQRTFPVGSSLTLVVSQTSGIGTTSVYPNGTGADIDDSRVELNSSTVINVDSVTTWSAAFNGGSAQASFFPGATVFVRAAISDPFGSFDIASARITILDAAGATIVNDLPMTHQGVAGGCGLTTTATCIYQYQHTLAAAPALGAWTVRVTGVEGAEGTVTDLGVGSFTVAIPMPSLTMLKTSTILSDPTGSATPKRIPRAVVRYEVSLTNSGPGTVDANTLMITDPIPADSAMYVSTTSGNPVLFVNGATPSGLTFNYATNVSYSSTGASGPWTYVPVPDVNGFDAAVRAVRIVPGGVMSAAGPGNPSFTIQFRVRIN